ncbi:CPBP family intramembrane glutamic endopeptidase [Fictibacillus enclensis]|uniref:CPBP family intramembrane glutamic endopeptidase n=1 Tax=Fictibacillus enclensis TaxID=1017270 RepID=UPI003337CCD1
MILHGTILVLVLSVLFAYIRDVLPFDTSSTQNINKGIQNHAYRLMFPLLVSPILEELIFRKGLPIAFQEVLGRKGSILLSNVLFSLFHFDVFFLPYLVNGLIYALYYEKSKDLKVPVSMHISYNAFVFLVTFF